MDKLQIFIITYNRAEHLSNTLEQIYRSPIRDYDITILDNCSTDNTQELCKRYPYRYIRHNRNIGGNANIARAFELANSEYVWILCDDDLFDFTHWQEVENTINQDYHCIMVANYANPASNIAQFLGQSTFVPSCIYKMSLLDDETMLNIYCNIPFMFPHFAPIAKIINENLKIKIMDNWIVKIQCHGSEETYTRGLNKDNVHPIYKNMFWQVGFLNALQLINNDSIRNEVINTYKMPNATRLFFDFNYLISENNRLTKGNQWNLLNMCANTEFNKELQRSLKNAHSL